MPADRYVRDHKNRPCVSISEAARRKGVSKEAIRQAIQRGALESTVLNAYMHLIPVDSLNTYTPDPKHLRSRRSRIA